MAGALVSVTNNIREVGTVIVVGLGISTLGRWRASIPAAGPTLYKRGSVCVTDTLVGVGRLQY